MVSVTRCFWSTLSLRTLALYYYLLITTSSVFKISPSSVSSFNDLVVRNLGLSDRNIESRFCSTGSVQGMKDLIVSEE